VTSYPQTETPQADPPEQLPPGPPSSAELNADLPEWAEYADSFGSSLNVGTERGQAIGVIDKALQDGGNPVVIADALVDAGLLANEFGPSRWRLENRPRPDLIRRVRAYQDEANEMTEILAEALSFPLGDGKYVPVDQRLLSGHTPPSMARLAAKMLQELKPRVQERG
jgi:hypothetical protein